MMWMRGMRVAMIHDGVEVAVPKGTLGTIICMDYEDTDIYTYSIQFDNGILASGIRQYHLELM